MYKLKDIISSRGRNPKINKALDRYELSKDEKKDIINTIKMCNKNSDIEGLSEWKYYDIKDIDTTRRTAWGSLSAIAKFNAGSSIVIMPPLASYLDNISVTPVAVAINTQARLITEDADILLGELITNVYLPTDLLVTEITKEEFYNLQ